jgi:hypothetical protein
MDLGVVTSVHMVRAMFISFIIHTRKSIIQFAIQLLLKSRHYRETLFLVNIMMVENLLPPIRM